MIDWKIQARARACQNCQNPFVDKQAYYTILFDRRHSLERLDVCNQCWESQFSQGVNNRKGFLSFWQGVFNLPAPPPAEAIQKETAESLLRKLIEVGDPKYEAACFILAVMLERKKIIRVKSQRYEEGKRLLYYEHPKNGDVFQISDPQLQLDQLEQVQHEIGLLLEHGLPGATSTETQHPSEPAAVAHNADSMETDESPKHESSEPIDVKQDEEQK